VTSSSWYRSLSKVVSLGAEHEGAGSLAGLHAARKEHLSQFFTPDEIVSFLWRIVTPAMNAALEEHPFSRIALLDNSVGSGRMFRFADPAKHTLAGCDVHGPSVEAVATAAQVAGFKVDFLVAGMEEIHPIGFGVALINPPFSIQIEGPNVEPFPCASFGKFGPGTSCVSHAYAVAQALQAADIVVAVLPSTFADTLAADPFFSPRLRYLAKLPRSAFSDEGANVATTVAVWDSEKRTGAILTDRITDIATAAIPDLRLSCRTDFSTAPRELFKAGIAPTEPSIKTPVSGNAAVRVVRHNRRVILKFACGLVEAKVLNAILVDRVPARGDHRYPVGVTYIGQGLLDLEVHLIQTDPVASFRSFVRKIEDAGGQPMVDPGIWGYLRRKARQVARHNVPFAHAIRAEGIQLAQQGVVSVESRETFLLDPKKWGGPVVKKGDKLEARRGDPGKWVVLAAGCEWPMTDEEVNRRFCMEDAGAGSAWVHKFPGRCAAFPQLAHQAARRAEVLGIGQWLTWDYQLADLAELAISPFGSIVAWEMGLGKTRLAIAMFLMGGSKHNLHVTEAHLVPEVVMELQMIGLPENLWRVIDSPEALDDLRIINVISYHRLRQPLHGKARPKATYAKALRRRIGTMICDEGHCLRNLDTEQTRAVWGVAARRRLVFTGTLVANYPRDTLAIMAWAAGSATVAQPYGIRSGIFLEERLATSMSRCSRGVDAFREAYVTTEWVTNEFSEDLQSGAKREVPKIANLPRYREMLAPLVKRRVVAEPDVAKFVRIPPAVETVVPVRWSNQHLGFYLDVAENFANWYRQMRKKADQTSTNLNLIALLARIGAVETACNVPQSGIEGFPYLGGLTSKQAFAIQHITRLVQEGHKIIVYVKRPRLLEIIGEKLTELGIDSVMVHGGLDIDARTKDMRDRYRFGSAPVLLATLGCVQTGLNLPETTRIVYLSRDWSAKTERQANARALRPQQKQTVGIDYIHLPGSIDDYQAQMVDFKADAADSGLDWATPRRAEDQFLHLDTIMGRFVEDVAKLRGTTTEKIRSALSPKAA
jgi:hypothetical protein